MYSELLSRREYEVASLIAKGLPQKEISQKLCIETRSINNQLNSVFRKLNIRNREELVYLFYNDMSVHKLGFKKDFETEERIDMIVQLVLWKQNEIHSSQIEKIARIAKVHVLQVYKYLRDKNIRVHKMPIFLVKGRHFSSFKELSKAYGVSAHLIWYRFNYMKWDIERAATQTPRFKKRSPRL